ncbi:MAG: peptidoglycan-associated lipoprotein Pal [Burkholderiales bacterium]|nr:peptidoglycan-associated lipoprotein Pal [Burkholderiales bacterium]
MTALSVVFLVGLAACSSTPTKEQEGAAVEDRKPDAGPPPVVVDRPPVRPVDPAAAKGLKTDSFAGSPLRDPKNILSKRSIFFDYDSNLVKEEYKPIVAAHARYLQQHAATKMRIEGNADERGSREYNLALGQRRADAVKQMMQILGAKANQVETVSFGEEKPRCNESSESCWAQNRRGDIVYQGE